MATIATVDASEFDGKVARAPTAVVDFYQESCAPCRALEPRLERIAGEFPDVPTYRVDIDKDLEVARRLRVKSLPTLLLMRNGAESARLDGLIRDEQIRELFGSAKQRDRTSAPGGGE